jgi:hypothetical protein
MAGERGEASFRGPVELWTYTEAAAGGRIGVPGSTRDSSTERHKTQVHSTSRFSNGSALLSFGALFTADTAPLPLHPGAAAAARAS